MYALLDRVKTKNSQKKLFFSFILKIRVPYLSPPSPPTDSATSGRNLLFILLLEHISFPRCTKYHLFQET